MRCTAPAPESDGDVTQFRTGGSAAIDNRCLPPPSRCGNAFRGGCRPRCGARGKPWKWRRRSGQPRRKGSDRGRGGEALGAAWQSLAIVARIFYAKFAKHSGKNACHAAGSVRGSTAVPYVLSLRCCQCLVPSVRPTIRRAGYGTGYIAGRDYAERSQALIAYLAKAPPRSPDFPKDAMAFYAARLQTGPMCPPRCEPWNT